MSGCGSGKQETRRNALNHHLSRALEVEDELDIGLISHDALPPYGNGQL